MRRTGVAFALTGALAITAGTTAGPGVPEAAAAPAALTTGFNDAFLDDLPDRAAWLARIRGHGATDLRILSAWALSAPRRPSTKAAALDPTWTGYRFADLDARVRDAVNSGTKPMIMIFGAPRWAEGADRPVGAPQGTWKPSSTSFGRFMQAVASRYDGRHADPAVPGGTLPRVRNFQVWNEPNLAIYLSPQWTGNKPTSPRVYRSLQNAAWRGIKRVRRDATVVSAGASPFGETPAGSPRMRPVRFWREVLCLNRRMQRTCGSRTKVDVLAHHPYPTNGPPSLPAYNRDDMSVADIPKLARMGRAARRNRTLGPRTPRLWVSEFAVRSNPPAPNGYAVHSLRGQAAYLAESQWRLWRAGVSKLFFFNVLDEPGGTRPSSGHGLYLPDGRVKPSARAAEFPVYSFRSGGGRIAVWVRSPQAGRLTIEVRRGPRWRAAATVTVRRDRPRTIRVPGAGVSAVRAIVRSRTSHTWRVR